MQFGALDLPWAGGGDCWYDLGSVVTGPSDPREIAAYEAGRGGVLFLVL
jgi:hypothetical protein